MIVGIPRETSPGERRVALVPDTAAALKKAGLDVALEPDAGAAAGFPDAAYQAARIQPDVLAAAEIVLKVAPPTPEETARLKEGAILIGFLNPFANTAGLQALAGRNV